MGYSEYLYLLDSALIFHTFLRIHFCIFHPVPVNIFELGIDDLLSFHRTCSDFFFQCKNLSFFFVSFFFLRFVRGYQFCLFFQGSNSSIHYIVYTILCILSLNYINFCYAFYNFPLWALGLTCSSFSRNLSVALHCLFCAHSVFLMWEFTALSCSRRTAFIASHRFWYVVFKFLFDCRY